MSECATSCSTSREAEKVSYKYYCAEENRRGKCEKASDCFLGCLDNVVNSRNNVHVQNMKSIDITYSLEAFAQRKTVERSQSSFIPLQSRGAIAASKTNS